MTVLQCVHTSFDHQFISLGHQKVALFRLEFFYKKQWSCVYSVYAVLRGSATVWADIRFSAL